MNKKECIELVRKEKVGYLATSDKDSQPYVRPVDMKTVYGDDIYFSTFITADKIKQIEQCNKVEAIFVQNYTQLRIIGTAELIKDESTRQKFLADNKGIADMLENGDSSSLLIYRIIPKTVRYMGGDDNTYTLVSWM